MREEISRGARREREMDEARAKTHPEKASHIFLLIP
jgi:hypothetical protein